MLINIMRERNLKEILDEEDEEDEEVHWQLILIDLGNREARS